jgi:SAM-dependent methyltransferase
MIRRYYDHNTTLFLALGGSGRGKTIHRALWAPGVRGRAEALETPHRLLEEQAAAIAARDGEPPRLLDLGCGIGGSLFALADRLSPGNSAGWVGVTISSVQVRLARAEAQRRGLEQAITFLESDFLSLPPLAPAGLAFSIEAFSHASDPARYFASAAGALRPGGRLVLIDDFLRPHPDVYAPGEARDLAEFRSGWHTTGLADAATACAHAASAGFSLIERRDLTGWVRVDTWRDRVVALSAAAARIFRLRGPYWDSLTGGDALRRCIASGLTGYEFLLFEKNTAHE